MNATTTLYVPSETELAAREEIELLYESLFRVAEAAPKLGYALDHLALFVKPAVQPGMVDSQTYAYVTGKIAEARALLRFALSAVDLDAYTPTDDGHRIATAVASAVAAVPFPACSLSDPADEHDIRHAYAVLHANRLAAARRALDALA